MIKNKVILKRIFPYFFKFHWYMKLYRIHDGYSFYKFDPYLLPSLRNKKILSFQESENFNLFLKCIKKKKININIQDSSGETLLLCAVHYYPEVIPYILEAGAGVNVASSKGETPLMLALEKAQAELIDLFLQYGADVKVKTQSGRSVFFYNKSLDPNITNLLLQAGADIDSVDQEGNTPLLSSLKQKNQFKQVEFYLQNGANVNHQNHYGETPLMIAVKNNYVYLDILLKYNPNPHLKNNRQQTVLELANICYQEIVQTNKNNFFDEHMELAERNIKEVCYKLEIYTLEKSINKSQGDRRTNLL